MSGIERYTAYTENVFIKIRGWVNAYHMGKKITDYNQAFYYQSFSMHIF